MSMQIKRLFDFGPWCLDATDRVLLCNATGQPVPLTPKAVDTLVVLVENHGRLVTKDDLMQAVWPDAFVEEAGLARNISALRKALGEEGEEYIQTLPKRGYRFAAMVRERHADPALVTPAEGSLENRASEGKVVSSPPHSAAEDLPPGHSLHDSTARSSGPAIEGNRVFPAESRAIKPESRGLQPTLWIAGVAVGALLLVVAFGLSLTGWWNKWLGRSGMPIRSIAVLPLENLSGEPSEDYFSDGMTDELITDIAELGSLRVISRTSVIQYKGTHKQTSEIGRELGVDAIVEGSVERASNRVRIRVQLINAAKDQHLWAESYDRELRDVLLLQREVAEDIARRIEVNLTGQERKPPASARPVNPAVYEAYLKGRFYWSQISVKGDKDAIKYLEQVIALDPVYAPAYAGLTLCYIDLVTHGALAPDEAFPKAKAAALKALALDETLPEAHVGLAAVYMYHDGDWSAAEREYKRAYELNPSDGLAHSADALILLVMGRQAESAAEIRQALAVDPVSKPIRETSGYLLYANHQYEQAIDQVRESLKMYPDSPDLHSILADACERKRMYQQAVEEDLQAFALSGASPEALAELRRAFHSSGMRGYWQAQLKFLSQGPRQESAKAFDLAQVYAMLDDKDRAFQLLERAYQEHSSYLVFRIRDPHLDGLRSDPRFQDLLRRIGLPP